jgi:hypothetical protein
VYTYREYSTQRNIPKHVQCNNFHTVILKENICQSLTAVTQNTIQEMLEHLITYMRNVFKDIISTCLYVCLFLHKYKNETYYNTNSVHFILGHAVYS